MWSIQNGINRQVTQLVSGMNGSASDSEPCYPATFTEIATLLIPDDVRVWIDSLPPAETTFTTSEALFLLDDCLKDSSRRSVIRDWVAYSRNIVIKVKVREFLSNSSASDVAEARNVIIDLVYPVITHYVNRDRHGKTDPDRFAQEIVILLLRNYLQDVNTMQEVRNWVALIRGFARRRIIDDYRKTIARGGKRDFSIPIEKIPSKANRDEVEFDEMLRKVRAAVDGLEPTLNITLLLWLDDFPVRRIAQVLDIPEGTVKSRLFTARKLLRECDDLSDFRER